MADSSAASQQLFDLWRKQFEEGTQAWARLVTQAPPPSSTLDPAAFWRPVLDQGLQTWSRLMAQTPMSPELMGQWKQFLDQWIAAWSKALEQAMSTETFAQAMGKQLESFLGAAGPIKKAAEQQIEATLSALGVPSRSQVVGLARQLVQLEEKVDGLEERLDEILSRLSGSGASVRTERV